MQNSIGIVVGNAGTFNVLCAPATQLAGIYIAGIAIGTNGVFVMQVYIHALLLQFAASGAETTLKLFILKSCRKLKSLRRINNLFKFAFNGIKLLSAENTRRIFAQSCICN